MGEIVLLRTPDTLENVILESQLELPAESSERQLLEPMSVEYKKVNLRQIDTKSFSGKKQSYELVDIRNLPIISIGKPESWEITSLYGPEKIPTAIQSKLKDSDFYLVRLCCSFRSSKNENSVDWARFVINLHSDAQRRQPIAYDLYPMMITNEVTKNVKLTLSPTLKFKEIEGNIGSIEFGLEYMEIQPIISAAGVNESMPNWDYKKVLGAGIQGSKFMYMLMEAPKGMKPIKASLYLQANVKIQDHIFPFIVGMDEKGTELLNVDLVK
ncbi:hypothetical protein SDC9_106158 [bioreactor metagenome]|uniref:Uncharacterized protein n=1 Tax=bioreactor metagenome TaxID=1076179 RepID=A0A645B2L2_9ZZZZ